jgi:hypothetical protein
MASALKSNDPGTIRSMEKLSAAAGGERISFTWNIELCRRPRAAA